jgi:hypothetical protein
MSNNAFSQPMQKYSKSKTENELLLEQKLQKERLTYKVATTYTGLYKELTCLESDEYTDPTGVNVMDAEYERSKQIG